YEAAAEELDRFAGIQFDPQVVTAFHRVPREDWQRLHDRSIGRSQEEAHQTHRDNYQSSTQVSRTDQRAVDEVRDKQPGLLLVKRHNLAA
ncbi:MAG TPA: hypothetical protein VF766_10450, partial [Pyrinomonadaceae bacterium]